MSRYTNPVTQILDGNGDPVVGARLYFYEVDTETLKTIYSDPNLVTSRANPVLSDGEGRNGGQGEDPIYLDGLYRVVQATPTDTLIWEADPVGNLTEGEWQIWASGTIYNIPQIVLGSDGEYYRSLVDSNTGNDPTSSPSEWELLKLGRVWNTNVTYAIDDSVYGSDGLLYRSRTGSNAGNNPITNTANWSPGTFSQYALWLTARAYDVGDIVRGSDDAYYQSQVSSNTGNDPTSLGAQWQELVLAPFWNTALTYSIVDSVYGSDGLLYASRTNSNSGNNPTSDTTNWSPGINVATVVNAGTVQLANQGAMEAETPGGASGSSLTVTPDALRFGPSTLKAHCLFRGTGTPIMLGRYNIDAAINDVGTGTFGISISNDMTDADYTVTGGVEHTSATMFFFQSKSAGAFQINVTDASGVPLDPNGVSIMIGGVLA